MDRQRLIEDAWRMRVDTYAARVSQGRWVPYPWITYVLRKLQTALMRGNARIIINAPPRHGKSEGIAHWLITWYLDWFPDRRVIFCSHGQEFANEWGLVVRDEFQPGKETRTRIRKDKSAIHNWRTTLGGGMTSLGVDGSIMGKGFDVGVIDDPYKNYEEASSRAVQRRVIYFLDRTFYNRCEPNGSMIINHTRWNDSDLTAHIKDKFPGEWVIIELPSLAEEGDLLGRGIGEALCPERFTREKLLEFRAKNPYVFASLYQQCPTPEEGSILKKEWFKEWDILPVMEEWIQSWDLNLDATSGDGSYVVGQIWGKAGVNFYLVDQVRARFSFPETLEAIRLMTHKWPMAMTKLIENKANGPGVISTLKTEIPGLIPVNPVGKKPARLRTVSGLIQSGNVFIPNSRICDWVVKFTDELIKFPNAANDDQVDTLSQALLKLGPMGHNSDFSIGDSGRRESPLDFT